MSPCYNALSHFYLDWVVVFNTEIDAMQQHIVNKATGQVCRPAEKKTVGKKTKQHKSKWNRLLQTQDMYLQFIRSNMGANGSRSKFSSKARADFVVF